MNAGVDELGLFPLPPVLPRISGFCMGGFGEWSMLSEREAVLELIVPITLLQGASLNDMNGPAYRAKLAAMLVDESNWPAA